MSQFFFSPKKIAGEYCAYYMSTVLLGNTVPLVGALDSILIMGKSLSFSSIFCVQNGFYYCWKTKDH